jgi:outer membrane protein OmpA-like peptidoglycan-associated protein
MAVGVWDKKQIKGKMKKTLIIIIVISAVFACTASAGTELAGTTSVNFLKIAPFAGPAAMADAYDAISEGVYGMYYNPAGISYALVYETAFSHINWFDDINYEYAAVVFPLPMVDSAKLGIAFSYLDGGKMQETGELGGSGYSYLNGNVDWPVLSDFHPYDYSVAAAYAMNIREFMSVGFKLRYNSQNIRDFSGASLTADFGMLYKEMMNENLVGFGITISNLGAGLKMDSGSADPPKILYIGVSDKFKLLGNSILVSAEMNMHLDYNFQYLFGAEYRLYDVVALRAGYKFGAFNQPTAGGGIKLGGFNLDYAYESYTDLGATHRFTVTYSWGTPPSLLSVSAPLFSTNPGANLTKVDFTALCKSKEMIQSARIDIYDAFGVKADSLPVTDFGRSVTWNGKRGDKPMPDGVYTAGLNLQYRQGISESNKVTIEIDSTPPALDIAAKPKLLKPGEGEKLIIPSTFELYAQDRNNISKWQLVVWDGEKKIFFTTGGAGNPPAVFVWDGKGNGDKYVQTGQIYYYSLIAYDMIGNRAVAPVQSQVVLLKEIKLTFASDALFDQGKADVKISAFGTLKKMKDALSQYPDSEISVAGYTDNMDNAIEKGRYKDNTALSLARANAVKFFMVNLLGVEESRIKTTGYGELFPLADNSTQEGRNKNRRVEITLTSTIYK